MNPVVAVILGYFLGGESIGLRTIVATSLILISVLVIATSSGQRKAAAARAATSSLAPDPSPPARR